MANGSDVVTAGAIEGKRSRRAVGGQVVGAIISVACIAFVATRLDFVALGQALVHFQPAWLGAGLVSLAAGYAMRIARWAMMLRAAGARIGTSAAVAPFLGSIALNNVLPFRAGDVVRALVFPARLGIERTTSTASLLLERVMDLAALVLCLGIGMSLVRTVLELPPHIRPVIVNASIAAGLALGVILVASPWIARFADLVASRAGETWPALVTRIVAIVAVIAHRVSSMSRPRVLLALALLSIPVWMGEAGLYWCLMRGLDIPIGPAGALTVMALTTLSTLVPSTPGYVGPFHLAAFASASMLGVNPAQAGAFAVLAHFTLWAATTVAGALAIMSRRDLFAKRSSLSMSGSQPADATH